MKVQITSLFLAVLPLPDEGLGWVLLELVHRHVHVVLGNQELVANDAPVTVVDIFPFKIKLLLLSAGP